MIYILIDMLLNVYFWIYVHADNIPIRGFVGHLEEGGILPHKHKVYLTTHLHFTTEYNREQVS